MTRTAGTLAAAALVLLAGGTARAAVDAVASAFVTAGATSNPLLVPDMVPVSWDEFTAVRASLRGRYTGPRAEQLLSYTYAGTFYANATAANNQGHELTWLLAATPTGRTDLRAGAGLTYGYLNSINPLGATGAMNIPNVTVTTPAAGPTGSVTYFGANANLNGIYRPNGVMTWSELTTVTSFVPITGDAGRSLALTQNGHFERLWGRNGLTLDLMGTYFKSEPFTLANGGATLPGSETLQLQALAGWRHEFSPEFYVGASAGVLLVDALLVNLFTAEPVAVATLHYQTPIALAEVVLTQSSQLNLYLGQPLLVDGALARLVVPIDRFQRFRLVGVGTAERDWTITPSVDAAIDLLAGDVGLAFTPVPHPFYASLDYTFQEQIGHTVGTTIYPSLHRQIVMLTLTATWGTDPAFH